MASTQYEPYLTLAQANHVLSKHFSYHFHNIQMSFGYIPHHLNYDKLPLVYVMALCLTHWGRVTHICVGNLTTIGSDNGLSPDRRQAIIWTNAGLLLIGPLGTNFNEILIEILTFSFKKMRLKVSSAKRRPFCLGLNELNSIKSLLKPIIIRNMMPYGIARPRWVKSNQVEHKTVNKNMTVFRND